MPAFYPEGDDPRVGDAPNRSLQKINSLLKSIDTKTGTVGSGDALTDAELRATPVPVIASQSTASNLKTQAQIIDSSGSAVSYAEIGTAGSPSSDVVSVQGVSGGTVIPVSLNGISPSSGRLPVNIGGDGAITITSGTVTANLDQASFFDALANYTGDGPGFPVRSDGDFAISGTVTANTGLSQPLTDTQLRATAVPVSGTFWPATQPVSGSVSISNFPATQSVSGTFWQATQPVSGTFWQATQPVSGTFWQATQPVSIASAISQKVQGWDIPIHDYRGLGYTSGNLTSVTYKTGGASGTTVATLTLGYDGSGNLTSVTKT
jgi:hypothetical protein